MLFCQERKPFGCSGIPLSSSKQLQAMKSVLHTEIALLRENSTQETDAMQNWISSQRKEAAFPQKQCSQNCRIRRKIGTQFSTCLFQQILSQDCCGLAAAMVAAHNSLAAFPQSCCARIRQSTGTPFSTARLFRKFFRKTVVGLLLRWWLLTFCWLLFHKVVARLLLRWWLLTTFLRVGCWCVAGASFCAWAAPGVLFLQGHQLCRALSPFCSGGWSYKAYCVLRPCPAKPASRGFAGVHAPFWGVV